MPVAFRAALPAERTQPAGRAPGNSRTPGHSRTAGATAPAPRAPAPGRPPARSAGRCAATGGPPGEAAPPRQHQQKRGQGTPPPASPAPPAVTEYQDSWSDLLFIALCRIAYGRIAGFQSQRSWTQGGETFAGMVEVSRALMQGRTAEQQRAAVIRGFPQVPPWFRRLFPYSRWGAELNARITPAFFTWLVGPMAPAAAEVGGAVQRSAVRIERCRYLAESGCVGMCANLCQQPTQAFFTQQLGMPLTMTPNFEDLSCEMVFGRVPPHLEEEPAMRQPCLAICPSAGAGTVCHKLQ